VTAIPDANYYFTDWSDGVLTASRQDVGVTGDITVTANFDIDTSTLTYLAGFKRINRRTTPQTLITDQTGRR